MSIRRMIRLFFGMMLVSLPALAGQPFGAKGAKGSDCGTASFHFGIDRSAAVGAPVTSVDQGVVVKVEEDDNALSTGGGRCGRYVVIRHSYPNGRVIFTRYGHLGAIIGEKGRKITVGQSVQRNEKIGEVGSLREFHFEVRPVDPYVVERIAPHTVDAPGDAPGMNWQSVHPVDPQTFDFKAFAGATG